MKPYIYQNFDDDFSITHQKTLIHSMPKSHIHQSYELYYLLSGERQFFIKDRTLKMESGDLVMIRPNVLHRTANGVISEHEKIIINFKNSFITGLKGNVLSMLHAEFQKDYFIININGDSEERLLLLFHEMIEEGKRQKKISEAYLQALLIQLLVHISRYLEENKYPFLDYISPAHERVSEIIRFINKNYSKNLTLSHLAERFYISPSYLSRIFKEVTEFSFVEYVNHVRVKEAINLLQNSQLKSYVIGKKVGFNSVTHYGRVFKEVTGYSPIYYRNMLLYK